MSVDIAGRHVVVTGGARGIGRAIADAFAAEGDRISLIDILGEELDTSAKQLGASFARLDVSDSTAVKAGIARLEAETGPVDVLLNVAGVMSRHTVEETDETEWDRVMGVNVKGVFNTSHAVIGGMRTRQRGTIINVGSLFARQAWAKRAAYCASKAAVTQFTRCLALEAAPDKVYAHVLSPGIMASEMTRPSLELEAFHQSFMTRVTSGHVGEPSRDIAGVAVFLASPAASYMTGEVVEVHGGYH